MPFKRCRRHRSAISLVYERQKASERKDEAKRRQQQAAAVGALAFLLVRSLDGRRRLRRQRRRRDSLARQLVRCLWRRRRRSDRAIDSASSPTRRPTTRPLCARARDLRRRQLTARRNLRVQNNEQSRQPRSVAVADDAAAIIERRKIEVYRIVCKLLARLVPSNHVFACPFLWSR